MSIEEMQETVEMYLESQGYVRGLLRDFVKNKSVPLCVRWDLFVRSELGDHVSFVVHWKSIDDDWFTMDGPYYVSRYETIETVYIVGWLEENHPDLVDAFKEEVLEMFLKSYEYDW